MTISVRDFLLGVSCPFPVNAHVVHPESTKFHLIDEWAIIHYDLSRQSAVH